MAQTKIQKLQAGTPVGGTIGQALVKNSGADFDYDWGTVSGGGGSGGGGVVSLNAEEDLVAGDTVGFSSNINDGAMKAVYAFRNQFTSQGSDPLESVLGVCEIDTNKYVLLIEAFPVGNSRLRAVVVQLNDDMTWTVGTASGNINGFNGLISVICKAATDKFFVATLQDATNPYELEVQVATVVGTAITLGGTDSFNEPGGDNANLLSVCQLDTDRVALLATGTQAGSHIDLFEITIAGNVPTIGTQEVISGSTQSFGRVVKVDTNKVAIVDDDTLRTATVAAGVWTVNAPVTLPSTAFFGRLDGGFISIATNEVWVLGSQAGVLYFFNYDVSGAPALNASGSLTLGVTFATLITDGTDVYCYTQSGVLADSGVFRLDMSGATITPREFGTNFTMASDFTSGATGWPQDRFQLLTNLGRYCLFAYPVGGFGSPDGVTLNFHVQGMTNEFIGIAQDTVPRGASVNVITGGIDTNQTGLIPGALYDPFEGGLISTTTVTPYTMEAKNATEILIPGGGGGTSVVASEQYLGSYSDGDGPAFFGKITTDPTGDVMYIASIIDEPTGQVRILRYEKDALTGFFYQSHVSAAIDSGVSSINGIVVLGSFVYVFYTFNVGPTGRCNRVAAADLTGSTNVTVSGTGFLGTGGAFTNGTNLFASNSNDFREYSVSGTTITFIQTITGGLVNRTDATYDTINSSVYMSSSTGVIDRYTIVGAGFVLQSSISRPIQSFVNATVGVYAPVGIATTSAGSDLVYCTYNFGYGGSNTLTVTLKTFSRPV